MVWYRTQKNNFSLLKQNKGQSVIEYIMLLAVVVSLYTVMTKTAGYQKYFGKNATHWNSMRTKMEYEYNHGEHYTKEAAAAPNGMYMLNGQTRFFMQRDAYEN